MQAVKDAVVRDHDVAQSWPTVVKDDVVFHCLEDYRLATIWEPPLVCSVCGLLCRNIINVNIRADNVPSLNFVSLQVSDYFISSHEDFRYGIHVLDGAILDTHGFKDRSTDGVIIQICSECHSSLEKNNMPRLALANHLYRGTPPAEFKDLTWIEEMVCAKYRTTAHITRIYQSSDPAQPKVFHGNVCAHDMNVVSTAAVLPRTPTDINGMLSVVFIGPGKLKPEDLGQLYKIRKQKVWRFLLWLKSHNRLYIDIPLDPAIMDMYPDHGVLPEIEHAFFEDHTTDGAKTFADKTAGFSEHPAEMVQSSPNSDEPFLYIEKMGVSDLESVKLAGCTFTSSALKNLLPMNSQLPDLVLHHSSSTVAEYDNPDLMPGMFPTLFLLGLGGFDNRKRATKLSFEAQANAFLDVPDKCFRSHHSYIFVALNIIQRQTAHLHTHFTVKKSKFDSVARNLTSVSPAVLQSLANHIQAEGKVGTLNSEELRAMNLLKQVNTISARIPGPQASKIFIRNEIRSYFSEFGLPHIYFTFNPSVGNQRIVTHGLSRLHNLPTIYIV